MLTGSPSPQPSNGDDPASQVFMEVCGHVYVNGYLDVTYGPHYMTIVCRPGLPWV